MADPPVGPQAANLRRDAPHQLVGVQAALHQHLALGGMDEFNALGSRGFAVRGIDDLEAGDVEAVFTSRLPDFLFGSDQHRPDDAGCRTVDDAAQRGFVARVHDNRWHGRHSFGRRNQAIIFAGRPWCARIGWHDVHGVAPTSFNPRYYPFPLGSKGATLEALSETSAASTPNS